MGIVLPGDGGVHQLPDRLAVQGILFRAAGELGADVQHLEIVVKGLNVKIGGGNSGLGEGVLQLQIGRRIAAGQNQIGLDRQQQLQIGLLDGAQIGGLIPQTQVKGGPGVVGGGD